MVTLRMHVSTSGTDTGGKAMRLRTVLTGAAVLVLVALGGAVVQGGAQAAAASDTLLSLNKPATASSSGGCCAAKNVDDGDTSTRWASASNVDPSWIYLDLGAT